MENVAAASGPVIALMAAHLAASLTTAEVRNIKAAIVWLMIQSALLAAIFASFGYMTQTPHLYLWAAVCVVTKVVLTPMLLWHYSNDLPDTEVQPLLGLQWSIFLVVIAVVVFYRFTCGYLGSFGPTPAVPLGPACPGWAIALTVIALGLYILTVRRDAIKLVIGVVLMENGVHLALVNLAPTVPETTLLGVTTNVVVLVWLLLALTAAVHRLTGTTDTTTLSRLRR